MSAALEVDDTTFDKEVLKSPTPVLVDFFATWCAPCKAIAPVLDEIAGELAGKLKVVKVDVDNAGDTAASFSIMAVPTLIMMKGGKEVGRLNGGSKRDLLAKIQPLL